MEGLFIQLSEDVYNLNFKKINFMTGFVVRVKYGKVMSW